VRTYAEVPRTALLAAGFEHTGRHAHSDNWRAPGRGALKQRTAVQFSAEDEGITEAVERATIVDIAPGARLRVVTVRRAQRRVGALQRAEPVRPEVMRYLNRLSDLLFVVARRLAREESGQEIIWDRKRLHV
jgi:hypothetical protein